MKTIKFSDLKFNESGVAKVTFKNKLTCVVERNNLVPTREYPLYHVLTYQPEIKDEEWTSCPCYNEEDVENELKYVSEMVRKFLGLSIVCINGIKIFPHFDYLRTEKIENWYAEIHAY